MDMHNFELTPKLPNRSEVKKQFTRFVKEFSDWYAKGKMSELVSRDTRFMLELQKQKLESFGLDMQLKFGKPNTNDARPGLLSYEDSVFENYIVGASKHITTTIRSSGKEIYSRDEDGGLSVVMQDLKNGSAPSPDTGMCCPNCGSPSTIGRLMSGCEFCGTKFLMDELYPKVMHIFVERRGKPVFDTKQIKKYVLVCALVFLPIYILLNLFRTDIGGTERITNYIYAVPAALIIGVMLGTGAWFFVNAIRSVMLMGKTARGGSTVLKSLIFCNKMHELDPTFSTEYFRDRSTSLLKFMLYSPQPQELAICRCKKPVPEKLREIVDITYGNSGVNKYKIRNGVCDVSLTFYTDSLHYHRGKILSKSDKIHISLRKVIKKPTDLGFSLTAVSCPFCSASFDAAKVRECPFCGNTYPLEENEWVVTDIRI